MSGSETIATELGLAARLLPGNPLAVYVLDLEQDFRICELNEAAVRQSGLQTGMQFPFPPDATYQLKKYSCKIIPAVFQDSGPHTFFASVDGRYCILIENQISGDFQFLLDSRERLSNTVQSVDSIIDFLLEQSWIEGAALFAGPDNALLACSGIPDEMLLVFRNRLPFIMDDGPRGSMEYDPVSLLQQEDLVLACSAVTSGGVILGFILMLINRYSCDAPVLQRMCRFIRDVVSSMDIPLFKGYSWMRSIIDNLPGAVFQYYYQSDTEQGPRYISPQVENIFGYSAELLMDTDFFFSLLCGQDSGELLRQSIERSAAQLLPWDLDLDIHNASGAQCCIHLEANPVRVSGGGVLWNGFILDVTEEKRPCSIQKQSSEKYRRVVDPSNEAIFLLSCDRFSSVNRQALALLGFEQEDQLLGKEYLSLFPVEEHGRAYLLQKDLMDGKIDRLQLLKTELLSSTGKRIAVEIVATAFTVNKERIIQCVVRDIEREQNLLIALEESERLYRSLFEQMLSAFALFEIVLDSSGVAIDYRILEVNAAFEEMMGKKRCDLLYKTIRQLMPEIEDTWIERYGHVALRRESIKFEQYDLRLDKTFEVIAFSPAYGQFATIFLDVTSRKKAEMQIRLERDRAQSFLNNAGSAFLALDTQGIVKMANRRLCEIIGHTEHSLIGKDWYNSYIPEENRESRVAAFRRRVDSDSCTEDWVEYPLITASGEQRLMFWRFDKINDPDSMEILHLLSGEDVTEQRRYEQYLNMYLKIVSASKDQLAFFDLERNIRALNDAMLYFLRRSREEVQNHHVSELFPLRTYREKIQPALEKAYQGTEVALEGWGVFPEYQNRYFRIVFSAYFGTTGIMGVVYSQQDLSNQVRLEREILEAGHNERRQIGMELHDKLSHDLLDLAMRSKVLSNSLMHEYPQLSRDADRISAALNGAIDYTRNIAHGLFPLNLEQGNLLTMFRGIMKSIHRSDSVKVEFSVDIDETVVDRSMATQLFFIGREAIVNSIKHSRANRISLKLERRGALGVLLISDDGSGMSIVDKFGIGINIMKYRARVIGGTMTVENKKQGGLDVKCLFPLQLRRGLQEG